MLSNLMTNTLNGAVCVCVKGISENIVFGSIPTNRTKHEVSIINGSHVILMV